MGLAPETGSGATQARWTVAAEAARAWADVATRAAIVLAVVLVLMAPRLFPFLKQFTVKSGEVNILGSKFEISQTGTLFPGLEIKDGRLLLQGKDISALPDSNDKLTTANAELTKANQDLSARLASLGDLLAQAAQQRDAANARLADVGRTVPGVQPVETAGLDGAIRQQVAQARTLASVPIVAGAAPLPAPAPALLFGVAFSADANRDQALVEARRAQALGGAPIALFQRQKYLRSVAAFASREAAAAALATYRGTWPTAYIVDFRSWCPAAVGFSFESSGAPSEVDCRF